MKISKTTFGWRAITAVQLDDEVRISIGTMKRSSGLITTSVTGSRKEGEMYYFTVLKDYQMTWAVTGGKATEKAITTQHKLVVAQIEKIIAECVVFYANLREITK
jgi:hypothetical protein